MTPTWTARNGQFELTGPKLNGVLDLNKHRPGMTQVTSTHSDSDRAIECLGLEAVQSAHMLPSRLILSPDSVRQRVDSIDISLCSDGPERFDIQAYWRTCDDTAIELEVLATSVDPVNEFEVLTHSVVPRGEILVKEDDEFVTHAEFINNRWLIVPRDLAAADLSLDGRAPQFGTFQLNPPYCQPIVIVRPTDTEWSYIELSHPDDCARILLHPTDQSVQLCFGMFGIEFEKGVILRGRVRGALVARDNDTAYANELFETLLLEAPPLSV